MKRLLVFFLVALLLAIHRPLYASLWTVDINGSGDFTSIQAAINAASSGDQITVLPGTYSENILLNGKNVTLTSTSPQNPLATIISGNAGSAVVEFSNGDESTLRGFGITSSYTTRGILSMSSSPTIELSEIFQNSNDFGGGMYFGGTSTASVISTVVRNNTAPSFSGGGGGVVLRDDADITFINSLFYGNSTEDEGGALNSSGNAHSTWINSTVTGNSAAWGGGLSSESPLNLDVVNSIIFGNSATSGGANLYAAGQYGNVDFWFSDLEGGYPGWPGADQGNIDVDPLFVAGPLGNYYLDPLSPCIDAGDDTAVFFTTDLDGNPRIQGTSVDMGAFEAPPATPEIMLTGLETFILTEVALGGIDVELMESLLVKVDAALSALEKNNPNAAKVAMNNLKALINHVEAQIDKKITSDAAAEIIQQANAIIAVLAG